MTVRFSGVHFLHKPSSEERTFLQSAVGEEITLREQGDVLILNTGSPDENFMDDVIREGLSGTSLARSVVSDVLEKVTGYCSFSRMQERLGLIEKIGKADSPTCEALDAVREPNYFVVTGARALSESKQDELAERLNRGEAL